MLYKGKKVTGPNEELVFIPRGNDQEDFVFKCRAVLGYEEFDNMIKPPIVPTIMHAGEQIPVPMLDNPEYIEKLREYNKLRMSWLILKSLEATEDLKLETVDMSKPETWNTWDDELHDAGFSDVEIGRVITGCMVANSLDQKKIDEARAHFLAMQREAREKSASQTAATPTMPSGGPAKDSKSDQTV